ncbi:MAG: hypothetical protein KA715_09915 [Xanthomonadaceae bacterium]|nr:hypothetical protein [Xanthomonadaceae bacterium]
MSSVITLLAILASTSDVYAQIRKRNPDQQAAIDKAGIDPKLFQPNTASGVFSTTPSGVKGIISKFEENLGDISKDGSGEQRVDPNSQDTSNFNSVELAEKLHDKDIECESLKGDERKECNSEYARLERQLKRAEEKEKNAVANLNCDLAENRGKTYCVSAKAYKGLADTTSQMTTAYSSAIAAEASNAILNKYQQQGGGIDASQAQIQGMRTAIINGDQAANRQAVIAGIGGSLATANYAAAIKADRDMKAAQREVAMCEKNPSCANSVELTRLKTKQDQAFQSKRTSTTAGMGALMAAVPSTMQAFQEQQAANMIRGDLENYKKWMAANNGTNTVMQYEGTNNLSPYTNPLDDTQPAQVPYDPNGGVGLGALPPEGSATGAGGVTWAGGGPGSGGGSGGGGGGARGATGGGSAPYMPPPMDPNAGKPTYANVDESGGGYRAGVGSGVGGPKLDMNSMLAQYLPKEGDKFNENGVEKLGEKDRSIASESNSLLDANVNIFERISDTYHRKAKDGLIKL